MYCFMVAVTELSGWKELFGPAFEASHRRPSSNHSIGAPSNFSNGCFGGLDRPRLGLTPGVAAFARIGTPYPAGLRTNGLQYAFILAFDEVGVHAPCFGASTKQALRRQDLPSSSER